MELKCFKNKLENINKKKHWHIHKYVVKISISRKVEMSVEITFT